MDNELYVGIMALLAGLLAGMLLSVASINIEGARFLDSELDDICQDFFGKNFAFDEEVKGNIVCKQVEPQKVIGAAQHSIGCGECNKGFGMWNSTHGDKR